MDKPQPPANPKPPAAPPAKGQPPGVVKATKQKKEAEVIDEVAEIESGEKASILKPGILLRAAGLAIINLIAIAAIVFLMGRLQVKAQEVKRLRGLQISAGANKDPFSALSDEIEGSQAKADELSLYFADSEGVVTFVGEIDKLKAEGLVTNFSFVNEVPIKDKTGALGLPLLIEIRGTWPQIDSALGRIMSLPYFIRAIRVEAKPFPEDVNLVEFKFGGFLYVD